MGERKTKLRRLMRLLLGGFFDLNVGGGFFHFAFEFVPGFLEFAEALPDPASQFGQFFSSEEENDDENDKSRFRPTRHPESKKKIHDGSNYKKPQKLQRKVRGRGDDPMDYSGSGGRVPSRRASSC